MKDKIFKIEVVKVKRKSNRVEWNYSIIEKLEHGFNLHCIRV
ncbi:hypothetical protein [Spiroplasma cantharicola]|nr:hypothetical protein [Spiroplasma cantharicola]